MSSNLVDVVFIKFWEQSAKLPLETLMSRDIQECVEGKSSLSSGSLNIIFEITFNYLYYRQQSRATNSFPNRMPN